MYSIRHVNTGLYIPKAIGFNGRGGSHTEPTVDLQEARTWKSLPSAKGWLTTWLKGKVVEERHRDYESGVVDDVSLITIPVLTRFRSDMEIVRVQLRVVGVIVPGDKRVRNRK